MINTKERIDYLTKILNDRKLHIDRINEAIRFLNIDRNSHKRMIEKVEKEIEMLKTFTGPYNKKLPCEKESDTKLKKALRYTKRLGESR